MRIMLILRGLRIPTVNIIRPILDQSNFRMWDWQSSQQTKLKWIGRVLSVSKLLYIYLSFIKHISDITLPMSVFTKIDTIPTQSNAKKFLRIFRQNTIYFTLWHNVMSVMLTTNYITDTTLCQLIVRFVLTKYTKKIFS